MPMYVSRIWEAPDDFAITIADSALWATSDALAEYPYEDTFEDDVINVETSPIVWPDGIPAATEALNDAMLFYLTVADYPVEFLNCICGTILSLQPFENSVSNVVMPLSGFVYCSMTCAERGDELHEGGVAPSFPTVWFSEGGFRYVD